MPHAGPAARGAGRDGTGPGALCEAAARAAEIRHGLPPGLLLAISQVETGRPNPATGRTEPWPWSVQANGQSLYFARKVDAIASVRELQASGTSSVDTGCLQINLGFHPEAFATLDDAFDPARNADYAARFLLWLHATTGDWWQATGLYHSRTIPLASSYRSRVEHAFVVSVVSARMSVLQQLRNAWSATLPAEERDPAAMAAGSETDLGHFGAAAPGYAQLAGSRRHAAPDLEAFALSHGAPSSHVR